MEEMQEKRAKRAGKQRRDEDAAPASTANDTALAILAKSGPVAEQRKQKSALWWPSSKEHAKTRVCHFETGYCLA